MEDIVGGLINWFINFMMTLSGATPEMLKIDTSNDQISAVITPVWGMLASFAFALTLAYFAIDLNKKMVFEGTDVNLKTFGFPFIKLAVAFVVIDNGLLIFDKLTEITNAFLDTVAAEAGDGYPTDVGNEIAKALGFWGLIIVVLPLLIGLIVGLVCKLVWVYKGFTFKCEYIARYMFAPIALADIYSGANTAAIRYIKGTLAFGLYGICLVVLPQMVNAVAIGELTSTLDTLIKDGVNSLGDVLTVISNMLIVVVAPIAAIGVVGAAKQITKEALGV